VTDIVTQQFRIRARLSIADWEYVCAALNDAYALRAVNAYIAEHKVRCYSDVGGMARRTAFQEVEDLISKTKAGIETP
jgi:hypothetical protein